MEKKGEGAGDGERTSSTGMAIERRQHERHMVAVDLTVSSEHQIFTALSGDVSEGGVFVTLDGAFATRSEWEALMASVRAVGVDEWLEAMPGEIHARQHLGNAIGFGLDLELLLAVA